MASGGTPLEATTVVANVPACVGVPVIRLVAAENDRPGGRPLALTDGVGVPVAVTWNA